MADEGLAMLRELGLAQGEAVSRMVAAIFIELAAERLEVAEAELRGALAVLDRLGAKVFANSAISALAEVLSIAGKDAEAEDLARLAAETAVIDDYDAQVRWRRARARVLLHRGAHDEAESLAREAVAVSAGTSDVCMQGDSFGTGRTGRGWRRVPVPFSRRQMPAPAASATTRPQGDAYTGAPTFTESSCPH